MLGLEGGTYGFKSQFWANPEQEIAIIILTNVMETDFFRSVMEAIAFQTSKPIAPKTNLTIDNSSGNYIPRKITLSNVAKLQGLIQSIRITKVDETTIALSPFIGTQKILYKQIAPMIFENKSLLPEKQRVSLSKTEDGKIILSNLLTHEFIFAQDYINPIASVYILLVYILCTLFFIIGLIINSFKKKIHAIGIAICGCTLGLRGIFGFMN